MYTIGTAAKATGKAKSTISKAISSGTISATKNADGSYSIDPAELHRVFPAEASANGSKKPDLDDLEPFDLRFENGRLQGELKQLRERMAELDTTHDRERKQLNEQLEDLRRRLDRADEERRDKDRQLTALLTDERPKAEAPAPNAGRGFWARFSRRSRSA
jgi:DNA repair exonuclease SbcCD ATPase subunit